MTIFPFLWWMSAYRGDGRLGSMNRVESYFESCVEHPNNEIGPLEFIQAESPALCNSADWFRAGVLAAAWLHRAVAFFHASQSDVPHGGDIGNLSVGDLLKVRTIDA
jgi:hypothetical protein